MSVNIVEREDAARARDRLEVLHARRNKNWIRLMWLLVGPGILVMLGENDAPSMLSYSASGSSFGIGFFIPFILVTFAMAYVAQEITVRLGAVSKAGHAELIYRRFGRFWGNFAMFDLLFTNLLTLITEFVGVAAGAGFFGVPKWASILGGIVIIAIANAFRRYWTWERIVLTLALFNLIFVVLAFLSNPNWANVGHSFLTFGPLPGGLSNNSIVIIMADIGATITPWMLFFQQGAVSDKGFAVRDLFHGRLDTAIGAFLAALAAIGCVIATSPLYIHHMNAGQFGAAQFAQALVPYIGHIGGALFALGILDAGLVAAATISVSSAYAFGEVRSQAHSLNTSFKEGKSFYAILLGTLIVTGGIVMIPHFPLEFAVLMVNVIAVLTMPPAIGFLLLLVNDKEVMGEYRNTPLLNVLGIGVGVFVSLAGVLYALTVIFPNLQL